MSIPFPGARPDPEEMQRRYEVQEEGKILRKRLPHEVIQAGMYAAYDADDWKATTWTFCVETPDGIQITRIGRGGERMLEPLTKHSCFYGPLPELPMEQRPRIIDTGTSPRN